MALKRISTIFVALCLALSALAFPALAAGSITAQPSAENDYTVGVEGDVSAIMWHTYSEEDTVAVNADNAVPAEEGVSCADGVWTPTVKGENIAFYFKIALDSDDVLTVAFSDNDSVKEAVVCDRHKGMRLTSEDGVYTIGVDGEYEIMVKVKEGAVAPTVTATVKRIDVGEPLEGQTEAKLNTKGLKSGTYVATVFYEDGSYEYTTPFTYNAPTNTGDSALIVPVMVVALSSLVFSAAFTRRKRVID